MENKINITGAILGLTAILLGAFGAHALKDVLNLQQLTTFETGVKYQMYHALFLLFLDVNNRISDKSKKMMYYFISFGTLFFSGSIYLLATSNVSGINFKPIGIITPIGGLLLIMGWGIFAKEFLYKRSENSN
jgi:uncharacterized membrane protein YgdD (TMEM256/DUF423 family)